MSVQVKERFEAAPWRLVSGYHDAMLRSLSIDLLTRTLRVSFEAVPDYDDAAPTLIVEYAFTAVEEFQVGNNAVGGSPGFSNYVFPHEAIVDYFECSTSQNSENARFLIAGIYAWHITWRATDFRVTSSQKTLQARTVCRRCERRFPRAR
jgi:hypothetical protein